MKRIILSAMVMAFAVAVQAGDAKPAQGKDKDAPSCCASKVKTSTEVKEESSPSAKSACCCCQKSAAKHPVVKQTALLSPKAASEAGK